MVIAGKYSIHGAYGHDKKNNPKVCEPGFSPITHEIHGCILHIYIHKLMDQWIIFKQ